MSNQNVFELFIRTEPYEPPSSFGVLSTRDLAQSFSEHVLRSWVGETVPTAEDVIIVEKAVLTKHPELHLWHASIDLDDIDSGPTVTPLHQPVIAETVVPWFELEPEQLPLHRPVKYMIANGATKEQALSRLQCTLAEAKANGRLELRNKMQEVTDEAVALVDAAAIAKGERAMRTSDFWVEVRRVQFELISRKSK